MFVALLPREMIYWRMPVFQCDAWDELATELNTLINQGAQGMILDLRGNTATNDFQGAARIASLFIPSHSALFTLTFPGQEPQDFSLTSSRGMVFPPFSGPVVVLADCNTAGAGEALAACLKSSGALLMEEGFREKNGSEAPSSLAVNRTEGLPLASDPLVADLVLTVHPQVEAAVLKVIDQHEIDRVVRNSAVAHRLNEAALVRGEDPEIDAYLAPLVSKSQVPASDPPQDIVLTAALDSLRAIRLSERQPVERSQGDSSPAVQ